MTTMLLEDRMLENVNGGYNWSIVYKDKDGKECIKETDKKFVSKRDAKVTCNFVQRDLIGQGCKIIEVNMDID